MTAPLSFRYAMADICTKDEKNVAEDIYRPCAVHFWSWGEKSFLLKSQDHSLPQREGEASHHSPFGDSESGSVRSGGKGNKTSGLPEKPTSNFRLCLCAYNKTTGDVLGALIHFI